MFLQVVCTTAAALSVSGFLMAQANPCLGQLIPLKPVGAIACVNAKPVCLSDPNGTRGHWVWQCGAPATAPTFVSPPQAPPLPLTLDPNILLQVRPPEIENPVDVMIRAQQLRQLRLQNEQMERELSQPSAPQQPAINPQVMGSLRALYACGVLDGMLKEAFILEKPDIGAIINDQMKRTQCDGARKLVGFPAPEEHSPIAPPAPVH